MVIVPILFIAYIYQNLTTQNAYNYIKEREIPKKRTSYFCIAACITSYMYNEGEKSFFKYHLTLLFSREHLTKDCAGVLIITRLIFVRYINIINTHNLRIIYIKGIFHINRHCILLRTSPKYPSLLHCRSPCVLQRRDTTVWICIRRLLLFGNKYIFNFHTCLLYILRNTC